MTIPTSTSLCVSLETLQNEFSYKFTGYRTGHQYHTVTIYDTSTNTAVFCASFQNQTQLDDLLTPYKKY